MTSRVLLGERATRLRDVVAVAEGRASLAFSPAALTRIADGARTLDALAREGRPIYGVTTGLGAAVDIVVGAADAVQMRVPLARMVGVGRRGEAREVRAIVTARAARLALGRSGIAPAAAEALVALVEAGVEPVVPMTGSVGEADLAPLAAIALALTGRGEACYRGTTMPAAEALAAADLAPCRLGGKDGLALVSSNAVSVGLAALCAFDARRTLAALLGAAALSFEGYRAALDPISRDAVTLRPLQGIAEAADALRTLLAGGDLVRAGTPRRLQDPLCLRCVAPVMGAALAALAAAEAVVEAELSTSDDNPAILAEDAASLPNASFDTTHLALAFEGLGLALARAAALCAERVMTLMSPVSSELPRFLSPIQGGRNGYATVQKTVAALTAEIQHAAAPMPVVLVPVADRVENYGTMATGIVEKTAGIGARLRLLAAVELMVAAQAVDLRDGIRLGTGAAALHAAVRAAVPHLHEDRPATPDIEALDALIAGGHLDALVPLGEAASS